MQALQLDFVARRGSPWAGRLLVAVALAFAGDVAWTWHQTRAAFERNQATLAKAQRAPARKVSAEEVAAARETVERLSTPWASLFAAIEQAASDQVALLAIEPDPKAGKVVISGEGRDYLAALTYVLNLQRAQTLERVELVRHEVKANDPQRAVAFSVSASWTRR